MTSASIRLRSGQVLRPGYNPVDDRRTDPAKDASANFEDLEPAVKPQLVQALPTGGRAKQRRGNKAPENSVFLHSVNRILILYVEVMGRNN